MPNPVNGRREPTGKPQSSEPQNQVDSTMTNSHPPADAGRSPVVFHNEPLTDFSRAESREKMAAALDQVRKDFGQTYPVVIDNQAQSVGKTLESVNPSRTSRDCRPGRRRDDPQANAAVASCLRAFDGWRDTPVHDRAELLRRLAEQFRLRRFELSAWIVFETGKPWREADADVAEAIDFCDVLRARWRSSRAPLHRDVPGEDNRYFYEPRGVAVVIAPWNFPLAILTGMATAALVAGNTVILKPAEQSSVIGAKLMECLQEAGVPPGVVNFVPGVGEEIGPTLVTHPDVALIAFTGSLKVGTDDQRAGRQDARRAERRQEGHRRDGRQERHHRGRRRRPRRGGEGRGRLGVRLRRTEVLGLVAGDRARRHLRPVPEPARGGDARASRSRRPRNPAAQSAR